jgi:hypothetical protein
MNSPALVSLKRLKGEYGEGSHCSHLLRECPLRTCEEAGIWSQLNSSKVLAWDGCQVCNPYFVLQEVTDKPFILDSDIYACYSFRDINKWKKNCASHPERAE